jgi:hypothetical protein
LIQKPGFRTDRVFEPSEKFEFLWSKSSISGRHMEEVPEYIRASHFIQMFDDLPRRRRQVGTLIWSFNEFKQALTDGGRVRGIEKRALANRSYLCRVHDAVTARHGKPDLRGIGRDVRLETCRMRGGEGGIRRARGTLV